MTEDHTQADPFIASADTLEDRQKAWEELIPDTTFAYDTSVLRDYQDFWVTIWVRGTIITGQVANWDTWMKAQRSNAARPVTDDHPLTIGLGLAERRLKSMRAEYEALDSLPDDHEYTDEQKRDALAFSPHLHLVNGQTFLGDGFIPSTGGVPMRVRYDSIDAWTYGRLSTS